MSSAIIGYDCDGKPLRAGDDVIYVVDPTNPFTPWKAGQRCKVVGPCPIDYKSVEIDAPVPPGFPWAHWSTHPRNLRKISGPELGDWSEIHKQTGWKPGKEVRRETEKTS